MKKTNEHDNDNAKEEHSVNSQADSILLTQGRSYRIQIARTGLARSVDDKALSRMLEEMGFSKVAVYMSLADLPKIWADEPIIQKLGSRLFHHLRGSCHWAEAIWTGVTTGVSMPHYIKVWETS